MSYNKQNAKQMKTHAAIHAIRLNKLNEVSLLT